MKIDLNQIEIKLKKETLKLQQQEAEQSVKYPTFKPK
jgi:hypothetical protein